ncbi:MAG: hypothetical protein ACTS3F_09320 [Phycisphaerales bacterium]
MSTSPAPQRPTRRRSPWARALALAFVAVWIIGLIVLAIVLIRLKANGPEALMTEPPAATQTP